MMRFRDTTSQRTAKAWSITVKITSQIDRWKQIESCVAE